MSRVLLDTNAYTRLLRGDRVVQTALEGAQVVFMSVIVLGELFDGFLGGRQRSANIKILDSFLARPTVQLLDVTRETSEIFGEIKQLLRRVGTPLPINDVWIAAHVVQTGARLMSYDQHFHQVPGLRLWDGPAA